MATYIIKETTNCIRTLVMSIDAESKEEALENYSEGEIIDEQYEPSGAPVVEQIEIECVVIG